MARFDYRLRMWVLYPGDYAYLYIVPTGWLIPIKLRTIERERVTFVVSERTRGEFFKGREMVWEYNEQIARIIARQSVQGTAGNGHPKVGFDTYLWWRNAE